VLGLAAGASTLLAACQTAAPPSVSPTSPPSDQQAAAPLSPPVTLQVQDAGIASLAGMYLALDRGYYTEEGLDIRLVTLTGAQGDVLPAVINGAVQIGSLAPGAAHFNAIARGVPVPAVMSLQVITKDDRSGGLVVRKDLVDAGQLTSYSQLKGARIGLLGLNSTSQYLCELALGLGNLSKADVEFVNLDSGAQLTALATKVIHAAYTFEPYVSQAAAQGSGVLQFPRGEYGAGTAGSVVVVSPALVQANRQAVERYVTATVRGLRDYYQAIFLHQGDRAQVISSLIAHTALKDPQAYTSMSLSTVDPNGDIDLQAMGRIADYLLQNGALTDKVDLSRVVDHSYLDYALGRLGRV